MMRFLRATELCKYLSISRATLYNWINPESKYFKPNFPKKIHLSARTVGWLESDVVNFLNGSQQ